MLALLLALMIPSLTDEQLNAYVAKCEPVKVDRNFIELKTKELDTVKENTVINRKAEKSQFTTKKDRFGKSKRVFECSSREDQKAKIAEIETEIRSLKKLVWLKWSHPKLEGLKGGNCGELYRGSKVHILSIDRAVTDPPVKSGVDMRQIMSPTKFLGTFEGTRVVVDGISTEGMTTNLFVDPGYCIVEGTETVKFVDGQVGTYHVLKPISKEDLARIKEVMDKKMIDDNRREWTDVTGQHKTEGTLMSYDGTSVDLQLRNGERKTIPVSKLSKVDRQYAETSLGLD